MKTYQELLTANGQIVFDTIDLLHAQSICVQVSGTFVATLTYEASNDGVVWNQISLLSVNPGTMGPSSTDTTAQMRKVDFPARYFRVRVTAYTSGTVVVALQPSTTTVAYNTQNIGAIVPGTGASNLGKAEDAAHTSGDTGVMMLGVRNPATPVFNPGSQGEYSSLMTDSEGRLVVTTQAPSTYKWGARATLTTTGDVNLRSAGGAGFRIHVTDIVVTNSSATGTKAHIKDGSTIIASLYVGPGNNVVVPLQSPLRLSDNTALNVALSAAVTDVEVIVTGFNGVG